MNEKEHIDRLFDERGKNDKNSTTLANTLDKDIQTVFNSPEKFALELLQNADDAAIDNQPIHVTFQINQRYLAFSHTGRHFDYQDVEAICDNAQQQFTRKKTDLSKTGFKGIGFKSVFVISYRVYIISRNYCFRFDRDYAKWRNNDSDRFRLDETRSVNNVEKVYNALKILMQTPNTILFLRNIQEITIRQHNRIDSIQLRKLFDTSNQYELYVNDTLKSKWLIRSDEQQIPNEIHQKLQRLPDQECPTKLKQATSVNLKFAFLIGEEETLKAHHKAVLFCYLPTQMYSGLPFLVNGDFLLSADRTQLLTNIWNEYMFRCIAKFHIALLHEFALNEYYCDHVLLLLTRRLKGTISQQFTDVYSSTIDIELAKIAFIPSHINQWQLLKWGEAISDDLGFFEAFPSIDLTKRKMITSSTVQNQSKLPTSNHFTFITLAENIEKYAQTTLQISRYQKFLKFVIDAYLSHRYLYSDDGIQALKNKSYLLTDNNKLVDSSIIYLPASNKVIEYPSFLNFNLVHPTILEIPNALTWLKKIGIDKVSDESILETIRKWLRSQQIQLLRNPKLSVEIVRLLCHLTIVNEWKWYYLYELPLLTKSGTLKAAKDCYLPSDLDPRFDLEKIIQKDVGFVDYKSYLDASIHTSKLKSTLLLLHVKEEIKFICGKFTEHDEYCTRNDIYQFQEYRNYLTEQKLVQFHKFYHYHIAYLPYMACLEIKNYAKFFFQQLVQHQEEIIEGIKHFRIYSKSNKNRYEYSAIHYLQFVLNKAACVRATNGNLYSMKDLYTPSLVEHLDQELKHYLPQMQTNYGDITINLSEELMKWLGARSKLTAQDAIKLLKDIAAGSPQKLFDQFQSFYKMMIMSAWNDSQCEELRQSNTKILASDGSLQSIDALYFIPDKQLCSVRHPNLLKSFPALTKEDMLIICRYFGVKELKANDYEIVYDKSEDNSIIKTEIKNLLKMVAITEINPSHRGRCQLLREWLKKINKLDILAVESLALLVKSNSKISFKVEAILSRNKLALSSNQLFYENHLDDNNNLYDIAQAIAAYLELSEANHYVLNTLVITDSNKSRIRWLTNQNYNIAALDMMDENCLLGDDTENQADTILSEKAIQNLSSTPSNVHSVLTSASLDDEITDVKSESKRLKKVKKSTTIQSEASKRNSSKSSSSSEDEKCLEYCQPADAIKATFYAIEYTQDENFPSLFANSSDKEQCIQAINLTNFSETSKSAWSSNRPTVNFFEASRLENTAYENEIKKNKIKSNNNYNRWTGRWGEEFAYKYFQDYYRKKFRSLEKTNSREAIVMKGVDHRGKDLSVKIIWFNKDQESNFPADINIIKNDRSKYIEVKTTYKKKNLFCKISQKEWLSMHQYGKNYRLFCIYNAGKEGDVLIKQIKDPISKVMEGSIIPKEIYFNL
ncbi:hypothetical protein TrispH2_003214 [Trichoplax sp. H2]|nr:hypothetical protein TrispH2_003214 [Trichoplax sp. H2]|eukprot:RDD44961.1 hypothetical protein TrispH2_003214 [Trichoplax sp. H2]